MRRETAERASVLVHSIGLRSGSSKYKEEAGELLAEGLLKKITAFTTTLKLKGKNCRRCKALLCLFCILCVFLFMILYHLNSNRNNL